ncbi:MAG: M56 family metallopeptidase [Bacteroidota bacterium]
MTTLDTLAAWGRWSLDALWLPTLCWTGIALAALALLRLDRLAHPALQHRLRAVLVMSWPVLLVATYLAGWALDHGWRLTYSVPVAFFGGSLPDVEVRTASGLGSVLAWAALGLATLGLVGWAVVGLLRLFRDVRATHWLGTSGVPAPAQVVDLVAHAARRLGVRPPTVRIVAGETVPLILGVRRPVMLIPEATARHPEDLRMVVLHELMHLVRRDPLVHLGLRVSTALGGWHPVLARLVHSAETYSELACDAQLLDASLVQRRPYARLLLHYATAQLRPATLALPVSSSRSSTQQRLTAMTTPTKSPFSPTLFWMAASLLTLTLLVAACTDFTGPGDEAALILEEIQESPTRSAEAEVFLVVEEMPELVGSIERVAQAMRYPEIAKKSGVEGRVIVQFVVTPDGAVEDAQVVRGIGAGCDEEAVRVTEGLTFVPGRQRGVKVPVKMTMPFTFKL